MLKYQFPKLHDKKCQCHGGLGGKVRGFILCWPWMCTKYVLAIKQFIECTLQKESACGSVSHYIVKYLIWHHTLLGQQYSTTANKTCQWLVSYSSQHKFVYFVSPCPYKVSACQLMSIKHNNTPLWWQKGKEHFWYFPKILFLLLVIKIIKKSLWHNFL